MKIALEVTIAGQRYVLKSDGDGERLRAVAELVASKIDDVRHAAQGMPGDRVAILAALNIADELLREREEHRTAQEEIRTRTVRLMTCLRSLAPLAAAADAERAARAATRTALEADEEAQDEAPQSRVPPPASDNPPALAFPSTSLAPADVAKPPAATGESTAAKALPPPPATVDAGSRRALEVAAQASLLLGDAEPRGSQDEAGKPTATGPR